MARLKTAKSVESSIYELSQILKLLIRIEADLKDQGITKFHNFTAAKKLLEMAEDDIEIEYDERRDETMC